MKSSTKTEQWSETTMPLSNQYFKAENVSNGASFRTKRSLSYESYDRHAIPLSKMTDMLSL